MSRKSKLKEKDIFINNNTTYEERRNKEKVWRFAMKKKEEGVQVKIGYNKVLVGNEEIRYDELKDRFFVENLGGGGQEEPSPTEEQ